MFLLLIQVLSEILILLHFSIKLTLCSNCHMTSHSTEPQKGTVIPHDCLGLEKPVKRKTSQIQERREPRLYGQKRMARFAAKHGRDGPQPEQPRASVSEKQE